LNDVLETMLFNLARGTGLAGLHGIAARQEHLTVGTLIRPLLFASRDQLETYATVHSLKHREDRSNADDYYARNRIRHHVVPTLTSINPGLWTTLPRTVERLRAAEQLMQLELSRSWQQLVQTAPDGTIRLPIDGLLALKEGAFRLSEWLQPYGFTSEQARQAWTILTREPGQQIYSATYLLTHERGFLLLSLLKVTVLSYYKTTLNNLIKTGEVLLDGRTISCTYYSKPNDFVPETNTAIAWLDADSLVDPLTIRVWQQGDRFRPLGLSGTKLVSDLLNDLKIEQRERSKTLVLVSGTIIAWVVGRRIGHQFRVRSGSQRLVRLELKASGG
jgi:tRNA(Ile)-lysidine synthase